MSVNYNATFTGLDAPALTQASSVVGAQIESRRTTQNIHEQITAEHGKLGVENNDRGAVQNSGAAGMFGNVMKAVTAAGATAAATAIAGPALGAAVGAGFAVKDGLSFAANTMKPPQEEGKYYTLAQSLKEMNGVGGHDDHMTDPIIENYPDSQGQTWTHGFFQPHPLQNGFFGKMAQGLDQAEEERIKTKIGTLQGKLVDHEQQFDTASSLAPKIGVSVAEGPTPPRGLGFAAPVLAMG